MHCQGAKELLEEVRDDIMRRAEVCGHGRQISVAVGCDYGKHRSVTICEELVLDLRHRLTSQGHRLRVSVTHRELDSWAGTLAKARLPWISKYSRTCGSRR